MGDDPKITFKEEKIKYFVPNHDDNLVVSIRVINARVNMVMIDICSFANVLYFGAF